MIYLCLRKNINGFVCFEQIGVQVGLFHGGKILCQPQKTSDKMITEKLECNIDETLIFDIQVCNIPRCAKICFVVYEVTKNSKGGKVRKMKESLNKVILNFISVIADGNCFFFV